MDYEWEDPVNNPLPVGWIVLLWCALLISLTLTGYQSIQVGLVPTFARATHTTTPTPTPTRTPMPVRHTAEVRAKPLTLRLTHTPTATPTATRTPTQENHPFHMGEVDLSDFHAETHLEIEPHSDTYPAGTEIHLTFYPGDGCQFGDRRACVQSIENGQLTFLTIHSGLGGEGEPFRRTVEGSGINSSAYSLERIEALLTALEESPAVLTQSDGSAHLVLAAAVRIPAEQVAEYFALPLPDALQFAADHSHAFQQALNGTGNKLVFETCGWKHPSEDWHPGVSAVTGSVYVVIFREV